MDKVISLELAIKALTGWETDPTDEEIEYTLWKLATDKNVGTKYDELEIVRAISGLTEWQKHVQTDSNIDRDITVAIEALKAQLGTNLAEVGTDCISRQSAIDAVTDELDMIDHVPQWVFDRLEGRLKQLPPAQPKIIYCKDCIHHSKHNDDYMCGVNVLAYVRETDYCSRGERRIDE